MKIFINRIAKLIVKYLDGELTVQEQLELEQWLARSEKEQAFFNQVTDKIYVSQQLEKFYGYDAETGWEKLKEKYPLKETPVVSIIKKHNWWRRIAVAASIILVIGGGTYFLFFNKPAQQTEIVKTVLPNDVKAPQTNRAMITLANGQKVYLDSAVNGTLAMQGNVKLVKLANGQIAYQTASGETINEIKYNILTNPRGSKVIDMMLADGSQVWLNAGSSVTFPVAFVGNERKVSITGEAYFEVAPLSPPTGGGQGKLPFIVKFNTPPAGGDGGEIIVLGTHFNINAYDDEVDIKVTLLEGAVKLTNGNTSRLLKPGQQAEVTNNNIKVVNDADLEAVMAWKNGYFSFDRADLRQLMREIARWYDVEVVYEGEIRPMKFGGKIGRDNSASNVLKILKLSKVNFRIEGEKIIVMP